MAKELTWRKAIEKALAASARPLEVIEADIWALEEEIVDLLREVNQ